MKERQRQEKLVARGPLPSFVELTRDRGEIRMGQHRAFGAPGRAARVDEDGEVVRGRHRSLARGRRLAIERCVRGPRGNITQLHNGRATVRGNERLARLRHGDRACGGIFDNAREVGFAIEDVRRNDDGAGAQRSEIRENECVAIFGVKDDALSRGDATPP